MNLIASILIISFFLMRFYIVLIVLKLSVGGAREECFLGCIYFQMNINY